MHAYGSVTITVWTCWPASTTNQSGLVTLTFDLENVVRVTCNVGHLCANFSLPRPLCSRVTPDVRDRQTSDLRQKHCLMPLPIINQSINQVYYFSSTLQARFHNKQ